MNDAQAVVFVVDDDRSMRESLQLLLRSIKLHAQAFASPQEFLAAARPDAPGCLILDVRMPVRAASIFNSSWSRHESSSRSSF